jgi:Flp pilus assembly protein TadG
MLQRSSTSKRTGAMAVEAALVHPVMMFIMLSLIVGGVAVFRYQQVAGQAREAARWASVRGADWRKETGQPCPTQDEIRQQAVLPLAAGMDPKSLSLEALWIDQGTGTTVDWDLAPKKPHSFTMSGSYVTNRVRVTVTYQFSPRIFFLGSIQMKSTCEYPMAF